MRTEDGKMGNEAFWELFLDTGAPEAYLLYRRGKEKTDGRQP